MGSATHGAEWQAAWQQSRPEGTDQSLFVELLSLPIAHNELGRISTRQDSLRQLVDSMSPSSASRLHQRLTSKEDQLGRLTKLELSTPLRTELTNRLAARAKAGERSAAPMQRDTVDPRSWLDRSVDPPKSPTPKPPRIPPPPDPVTTLVFPPDRKKPERQDVPVRGDVGGAVLAGVGVVGIFTALSSLPEWAALAGGIMAAWRALETGKSISEAAEAAGVAEFMRHAERLGLDPYRVIDTNSLTKGRNFPRFDALTPDFPVQVKVKGIIAKGTLRDWGQGYAHDLVKLMLGPHKRQFAAELAMHKYHDELVARGAWPNIADNMDSLQKYASEVVVAVPSDHVAAARSAFAERILREPQLREQFAKFKQGHRGKLTGEAEIYLSSKVSEFIFKRFVSIGVSSTDLKAMAKVAAERAAERAGLSP